MVDVDNKALALRKLANDGPISGLKIDQAEKDDTEFFHGCRNIGAGQTGSGCSPQADNEIISDRQTATASNNIHLRIVYMPSWSAHHPKYT
jgi:hypothetical protein